MPDSPPAPAGSGGEAAPPNVVPLERRGRISRWDSLLELCLVVLLALFLALVIKTYVAEAYMIRGHSMEGTFKDGQRVMIQKLLYDLGRGDIVVFASKHDPHKDLIKRIIGLPGDLVQVVDGEVILNGVRLEEDYDHDGVDDVRHMYSPQGNVHGPLVVPEGSVFVLGDNRPESQDSRTFGAIDLDSIKGRVCLRWWPAGDLRAF